MAAFKPRTHSADGSIMALSTAAYIAIALGLAVVCALKGKWGFVALGFLVPLLWLIGAVKVAKPRSWWAKQYYGDATMSEAEQHFVVFKRYKPPSARD
jgi:hypothetical protein